MLKQDFPGMKTEELTKTGEETIRKYYSAWKKIINTKGIIGLERYLCFQWQRFKYICKTRRIPEDSREKIEEDHQKTRWNET